MRICMLQADLAWHDAAANSQTFARMIAQKEADLFVLPEMWPTGFATEPTGVAEPADDSPSLRWMISTARASNAALAGSVATVDDGRYFNRFYFVKPNGSVTHYDKRHLFGYGGEGRCYTAGRRRTVVEWHGVRFLLCVCYDLRFPVWSRNRGDYDVALYVASWPRPRQDAWRWLLRARAIENQCYVVGVNRIGKDPACDYSGMSCAFDAWGQTVARCEPNQECAATLHLDMPALAQFRNDFPVLKDADEFSL
ncbi:MAG: amidohydrolase [Bacteroidaceae bacterium]|nr:amidohydrolase [Bacteroidaceae bacterium]